MPPAYAGRSDWRKNMAVNNFADKLVKKIFGSSSDIFLKNVKPIIDEINAWEPKLEKLSDAELQAQTPKFKEIIAKHLEGIENKDERRKAEQDILSELLARGVCDGSRRRRGA